MNGRFSDAWFYDPWASHNEVEDEYKIQSMQPDVDNYAKTYNATVLVVSH